MKNFKELFTEKAKKYNVETIDYILPTYWAPYLINDDPSGLSDEEQQEVDDFVAREGKNYKMFIATGDIEDLGFRKRNDANNLGGDVSRYTFVVS